MNFKSELHKGHRQRLRQRILEQGLDSLEPHEVLEYLLSYSIPRQDTNPIAHALIQRFGTLDGVLSAEIPELCRVKGVGPGSARWLATLGENIRALQGLDPAGRSRCGCMIDLLRYACRLRWRVKPPCTVQVCLDAKGFVLFQRRIALSRAWGEPEALRRALEDMLGTGAVYSAILQYTDLPRATFDAYDRDRARAYGDTLEAIRCQLLDVLVLSEVDILSLREQNQLSASATDSRVSLRERYERSMADCPSMLVQEIEACGLDMENFRTDSGGFDIDGEAAETMNENGGNEL